jgi:hypothetical protein
MDVFKEPSLFSFGENFLDPVKVTVCEEQWIISLDFVTNFLH